MTFAPVGYKGQCKLAEGFLVEKRATELAEFSAYDYSKQCWVVGPEAITLRRQQLTEELSLLQSPKALEYIHFLGAQPATLQTTISQLRSQLASLPV